MYETVKYPQRT